jgi:hypothetical protein
MWNAKSKERPGERLFKRTECLSRKQVCGQISSVTTSADKLEKKQTFIPQILTYTDKIHAQNYLKTLKKMEKLGEESNIHSLKSINNLLEIFA